MRQAKGETVFGIVEFVDGTKITVNHRRESRAFTLEHKANINYVSFLKSKKENYSLSIQSSELYVFWEHPST